MEHPLRSSPARWLPHWAFPTASQLSAMCCFLTPSSLQTPLLVCPSPQGTHPVSCPSSEAQTGQHLDACLLPAGLCPLPQLLRDLLFPPAPSLPTLLSLALPCFWLCLVSWSTLILSIPMFSPVSFYLSWLFHFILFPDTCPSSSPCFPQLFACLSLLTFLPCFPPCFAVPILSWEWETSRHTTGLFLIFPSVIQHKCTLRTRQCARLPLHRAQSPGGGALSATGSAEMCVRRERLGLQERPLRA